jgi:hypothetical protein
MPTGPRLTPPYLDARIPVAVIFNNTESFYPYLARASDPGLFPTMYEKGNRALLWVGDPKLVFISAPAPHAGYLRQTVGYPGTEYIVPHVPTPRLCQDILREPPLFERLVDHAGKGKQIQLIPYVTTPDFLNLAERLRESHGLDVLLPESPSPESLWIRDQLDTKLGFREAVGAWLGADVLAEGFTCSSQAQAAEVVQWLLRNGRAAIVKASHSNGGFGHLTFESASGVGRKVIDRLHDDAFLEGDALIVEERIDSPGQLFPAIEIYVPDQNKGAPQVTHVCTELFLDGKVTGQYVGPELREAGWYAPLCRFGLDIAAHLQAYGYRGIFDVDAVVDQGGGVPLLEVNPRRTAGTHAHEFACFAFGANYAEHLAVVCHNTIPAGSVSSADQLIALLSDLLYCANSSAQGIVITHTACLREAEFGCIVAAPSRAEAIRLEAEMLRRIRMAE